MFKSGWRGIGFVSCPVLLPSLLKSAEGDVAAGG